MRPPRIEQRIRRGHGDTEAAELVGILEAADEGLLSAMKCPTPDAMRKEVARVRTMLAGVVPRVWGIAGRERQP